MADPDALTTSALDRLKRELWDIHADLSDMSADFEDQGDELRASQTADAADFVDDALRELDGR